METKKIQEQQVTEWMQEVLEYRMKDISHVLKNCSYIEKYGMEKKDSHLLGFAYFYIGEAHYIMNEIDDMLENMAKAIGYLNESKQWDLLARAYNLLAIISINKGNAPVAMDYYLLGLACAKEHNIETIICSIEINLGYLYLQNGVYHEARQYFESAYQLYCKDEAKESNIGRLIMIYTNLANCYLLWGKLDRTREYVEKLKIECEPYFTDMDHVYVGCAKVRYYHLSGQYELRDACIDDIQERIDKEMPLMDIFDDLYALCDLCIEIERHDILWKVIERIETFVKQANIVNLEKRLLELKIKYYQKTGKKEQYLEAAAQYYEMNVIMETENQSMISNMIYIRTSLELANESKKKIEAINAILMEKSETDELTGLANRYKLSEYSRTVMDECIQERKTLAVEILDVDYFKEYNDNYGHQAGDECIKAVASLIKNMQNKNVFCARYGGDEFIIMYQGLGEAEVYEKAEALRENIMKLNIMHEYSKVASVVTISQGICVDVPGSENKNWDFLHVADNMLYRVKKKQRNSICMGRLHESNA